MVFDWLCELVYAGIPSEYWTQWLPNMDVDPVAKKLVVDYLQFFENALQRGLGLAFLGPLGVGKTSLMCAIGKAAILEGLPTVYTTAQRYLDSVYDSATDDEATLPARVRSAQVILLDELDKVYVKDGSSWVRKQLEDLFRRTVPYHKVLVLATNFEEEDITATFGESVASLLRGHLKFVNLTGHDHRSAMQEDWLSRLKKSHTVDYANDVVVTYAQKFYAREREREAAVVGEDA